ncbi:hypothetical protein [Clostridium saccharobutylicum]|uniref:Flagellar hook-length control protein FliK n=1 Tax=Clostridium saccharobutylicum DSM 13864 TaxID=1345695 RepID=U5MZH6_CLOSA|nr:hypothetical protein [Clostridium saccharobutylicum]AGX45076.1 hypothetical protein CLSA_c41160 [Clostridium saccharobutylicum DSM 13864]AQR92358.1 hypothetical protein CLOSC_40880 [Clostridium saccharobutylicum]AQS02261.1 hypothetical protein CSACC_40940 [Clostridium saccharobutylicum]AQS11864.1 hypothetical protein CLOBY_40220 [Clostridium saccharobutylicum]AQS16244.1 hypothetical protein CLOSACC_40940 [Clostridium saccharobutylicum]
MPGIWNVNSGYNINTKKVSSKLTFESGERFAGRVISKGDGKDVTIKLADGWQFIAELEGNVDLSDIKLVKFQVDGFEGGKLKLKLVNENTDDTVVEDENLKDLIQKEGLSKEDINVLKKMITHNISLTRENINEIKGLIKFNEKISVNPKEIDAFIEKYLQSKGISSDSGEGQAVKELLSKFLGEFKKLSSEDILAFVENNLDFSEENINSFNNLFKGDSSIEDLLKKINDSIKELDIPKNNSSVNVQNKIAEQLVNKPIENAKNAMDNINSALATKIYNENDLTNNKINILDVLKTLAANNDSETESVQESKFNESQLSKSLIEKLNDKELIQSIKDTIGDRLSNTEVPKTQAASLIESTNKIKVEELLSKSEGKEVKLTTNEFRQFIDLINKPEVDEISKRSLASEKSNIEPKPLTSTGTDQNIQVIKDSASKTQLNGLFGEHLDSKELIKSEIKNKIEDVRDIVKNLISQTESKEAGYDKVMNLIKSNINDIKVFNSISDEYYYLNFPVTLQSIEYPCQLIIKDNRKDGKKIDSTNAKMVISVKTIKLGDVDGYLTMKENRIDVKLKCDDEFTYVLNNNKSKLVEGLSTLGLYVNVSVESKDKPANIVNCRNFFNDITISAIDTKV